MKIVDALKKVGTGIGIFCVPIAFMDTIGHPSVVQGSSMEIRQLVQLGFQPTLSGSDDRWWKRDIIWVNKLKRDVQVGGVFIFTYPRDTKRTHIKRVTQTAGYMIRLRDGTHYKIPPHHCWMTSDNPANANDSHVYGPVNCGLIKGKATRVIWPPDHWKKL